MDLETRRLLKAVRRRGIETPVHPENAGLPPAGSKAQRVTWLFSLPGPHV
jgi:hypothetical protein